MKKKEKSMNTIEAMTDNDMAYENGRYHLTLSYLKDSVEGAKDAFDDAKLLIRSKKNSRMIYNWIRAHCHSSNWKIAQFLINKTEEGKNLLKDALTAQMEADLMSGFNDLGNMPTDGKLKREEILEGQLCVEAEQILEGSTAELGVNILSMAPYPICLINAIRSFL